MKMVLEKILYQSEKGLYEFKFTTNSKDQLAIKTIGNPRILAGFDKVAENYSLNMDIPQEYESARSKKTRKKEEQEATKTMKSRINSVTNHFVGKVAVVVKDYHWEYGSGAEPQPPPFHVITSTFDIYQRKK